MEPRLLYENRLTAVNEALENCFTEGCPQQGLLEAMRYSLLSGGKRIRPVLLLSFCAQCGGKKPEPKPDGWVRSGCGKVNKGKFCAECGDPFDDSDVK